MQTLHPSIIWFVLFVVIWFFVVREWFIRNDLRVGGPSQGDYGLSKLFAFAGYVVVWVVPCAVVWALMWLWRNW